MGNRARGWRSLPLVAVAAAVLATPGLAAAAPAQPDKGAAEPAASAPARACSLKPAAHGSDRGEWNSCLQVAAELSGAPAVNGSAVLRFTVRSQYAEDAVRIEADLPANLSWSQTPAGMARQGLSAAAPETGGRLDRARATASFAAGATRQWQGTIRAGEAGPAQIRVRALVDIPGGVDAAEDSVFLTVGTTAASSKLSIASGAGKDQTTAAVPAGTKLAGGVTRRAAKTAAVAGPASLPVPAGGPSIAAVACATGGWFYVDNNNVTRRSMNFQVQAWDSDVSGGNDLLAVGVTDGAGGYTLCFDNTDADGGGRQDVYIRFVAEVQQWRVENGGNPYAYVSGVVNEVPDATTSYGNLQPANNLEMRGLHAYDAANDAWLFTPGGCWDINDATCRQIGIIWNSSSVDGTYYGLGDNKVHLMADDPNSATTVVHEVGHGVMDNVYEDAYPPFPNCSPHFIESASSAGCAWTEGFAEWYPASVYNDPFFRWPNGASLNLETPTWGTGGWGTGDTVEGRVAGAMIDISDFANEPTWDRYGEGDPGNIWTTFVNNISATFAQFWQQRAAGGFNVADSGALASVYQNTIDYGFRDPMGNYVSLNRPTPTPHNYGFNTSTIYWSVVAVRPPAGVDYDLSVYDDRAQTAFLNSSAWGGATIDFVAVDSNRRPLGDYYPRITQWSGTGNYQVELAQGAQQLPAGSQGVVMGSAEVVAVRDTFLTAGVPVTISVAPGNAGQDAELFLLASTADPATWVRTRSLSAASSTVGGPGAAETITYTPPTTGWYGVVVLNKAGSGTYTLSRA